MDSRENAVLKTLLYADIFDYPLKKEEVYRFLISPQKIDMSEVDKSLKRLTNAVFSSNGYFFLKGRNALVNKRIQNEKISIDKINKAKRIIRKVSIIPFVNFIGISGALAMKNSDKNDDIDFFVISKKNFLWTTRFLLIMILSFLGVYRMRKNKNYKDKICLNMILDEENLYFKKNNKNLYIAHEITQLIPLFERGNTYKELMDKNKWVKIFLPNAPSIKKTYIRQNKNILGKIVILIFKIFYVEKLLYFAQFAYMKKHITNETIGEGFLGFHPFDYKTYVLDRYAEKLKEYKLIKYA